jgi:hypothetical protein
MLMSMLAAGVGACAAPALQPGEPRAVDRLVIAPYARHETCAQLMDGDRLDYRYESSAALDFEIDYHDGGAVLSPIVREQSTSDSGIFEPRAARKYCLVWQAGAPGAIIAYRILLRRAPR